MSIFANRKSKPKASFLSHARNISQRGTVFSIHANFHELFDQLKQVLPCTYFCQKQSDNIFWIQDFNPKKLPNSRFYWKISTCNNYDYKRGMIIFQDVLHIINNCEKICRKAKQDETSSILIFTSCYIGQCRRNLGFRRSNPLHHPPYLDRNISKNFSFKRP